jgi:hypothetical protein
MTTDSNGSTNSGFRDSLGNFWTAVTSSENHARIGQQTKRAIDDFTAMLNGQKATPAPTPAETPPATDASAGADGGDTETEEGADTEENDEGGAAAPASSTPAPAAAAPPAAPPTQPEEPMSWIATAMFNFMPDGVKEWAASASIPLATQGRSLIAKHGMPKVSTSPASFFTCMTGDKITEVPGAIHDYAKKITKMLGLGDNEELAMSISVGFISFLRGHLSFLPGVKPFESATTGPAKPTDLIGFATNTQTLLGLFKLAPKDDLVDPNLLTVFKEAFREKGITTVDNYFPTGDMTYGQFVQAYATMGRDLVAEGKWKVDPSRITDEMKETTSQIFNKYGISDPDGHSLADGLMLSSLYSSDMLKSRAALTGPSGPSTGGAAPTAGATGR